MNIRFDQEAGQTLLQIIHILRNYIVDFKDEQGEVSGKLVDVAFDAIGTPILMIARPENNDWASEVFTTPVPCKISAAAELYVY